MATTRKSLREQVKSNWTEKVTDWLKANGEDVLRVGSNEVAFPIVDAEGNEDWIVITIKIPTGSRDGDIYDGYSMAEDYSMKCAEKVRKAEESAKKKAEKMERDRRAREEKARLREERKKAVNE